MAWRKVLAVAATAVAAVGLAAVTGVSGASADPGGNNGTVKIHSLNSSVDDESNEPHVACDFKVEFFGFDTHQQAAMEFTVQAPSGDGVLKSVPSQEVSDDAAGGSNDVDAVFTFHGATDFDLSQFTYFQPQQGYHVKLTVTSPGLPGGKKFKVFWLQCPNENPPCAEAAVATDNSDCTPPPTCEADSKDPACTEDPCDDLNHEFDPRCTPDPCDGPDAGQNPDCNNPCNDVLTSDVAPLAAAEECTEETPTETPVPNLDTMPTTGVSLTGLIAGGAALVGVGAGLLLILRRRRDVGTPPAV